MKNKIPTIIHTVFAITTTIFCNVLQIPIFAVLGQPKAYSSTSILPIISEAKPVLITILLQNSL